jgi:hypothetical protein
VDIGLRQFSAANGIEVIDASAATGTVRLIGEWTDDSLDFRSTPACRNQHRHPGRRW